jgi:cytochrome b6-f complex iron-sulfur subunit
MEPETKEDSTTTSEQPAVTRRNFLSLVGWGSFGGALLAFILGMVRSMRPNVLYEPPTQFKAGKPEDYPAGFPTLITEEKVFIDRDEKGLFAMSAICTHLGCRVLWVESENGFHCPCHGAKFNREGINGEGPAPSPLPRLEMGLDRDGRIVVDKGIQVDKEFRLKV